MSRIWLFLHFIGFTMWLGGGLAVMVGSVAMKRMDRSVWGGVVDAQAAVYRTLIGPGAILVVLTGIVMTLQMIGGMVGGQAGPWLGTMQGAGILGALVMLVGAMPIAARYARAEKTESKAMRPAPGLRPAKSETPDWCARRSRRRCRGRRLGRLRRPN